MYFNVNFYVFLNKNVHLLVSELYIYQNVRCNNKKKVRSLYLLFHRTVKIVPTIAKLFFSMNCIVIISETFIQK